MRRSNRWQEWVSLAAGAWLFVSPWLLGFTATPVAAWTAYALGIVVVAVSLWAMTIREARNAELIGAIVGALVFVAPWVLAFTAASAATVNAWIVGAVVVVASLWAAAAERPGEMPDRRRPAA